MQHWWLVAAAFALGVVLTLAFMVRRVEREVPVHADVAAGGRRAATLTGAAGTAKGGAVETDLDTPTSVIRTPEADLDTPTSVIRTVAVEDETEPDVPPGPHGPGTAAPNADGSGPTGWDVKGNEDSMLYHTTESPFYDRTIAEVWFRDVASAETAGFNRWDSGQSQRGKN